MNFAITGCIVATNSECLYCASSTYSKHHDNYYPSKLQFYFLLEHSTWVTWKHLNLLSPASSSIHYFSYLSFWWEDITECDDFGISLIVSIYFIVVPIFRINRFQRNSLNSFFLPIIAWEHSKMVISFLSSASLFFPIGISCYHPISGLFFS